MFKFQPDSEHEILVILDQLRVRLGLPSRGHVVEFAIRKLWISEKLGGGGLAEGEPMEGGQPEKNNESTSCRQTLFLDFQMSGDREFVLITKSELPLINPRSVIAAFNKSAFEVPGGRDACIHLLRSLEMKFDDRFEYAGAWSTSNTRAAAPCWAFVISNLESVAEFHHVIELFLTVARTLAYLAKRRPQGESQPPEGED